MSAMIAITDIHPVVTVVPITSQKKKALPTHVKLSGFGLDKCRVAMAEQIQTLDKKALTKKIGSLDKTATVTTTV